jgi:uncharacterized delta-60 repeat protein
MLVALFSLALASSAAAVPKGQVDTSYGSNGFAAGAANTRLLGTAVQSDGKVVAVGASGYTTGTVHLLVMRFTSSGHLDSSFSGGQVNGAANVIGSAVAVQPDGKIVVAGTLSDATGNSKLGAFVERFNSNGSADGSFGSGGVVTTLTGAGHGQSNAIALSSTGEIVVAGDGTITTGADQFFPGVAVIRIGPSGHLDTSEVVDLGRYSIANGVAVQSDGKIVVGGTQRGDLQTTQVLAARFNSDGSRDTSFAGGLFVHQYANGAAYSGFNGVAIQPDGKVVLAGTALAGTGINALVVRLNTNGSLDGSFASGGASFQPASNNAASAGNDTAPYGALGVVVSAGEIFTAGWFDDFGVKELALWGLTGSGAADGGFGAGGRTILSGGSSNNFEANSIAVAPGGNLVVAGDTTPVFGAGPTAFTARFGGPFVTPPPPPNSKPSISGLKISPKTFKAANKGGSTGKSGLKITYTLNEAAKTTFTVTQSQAGVKSGKRCVAPPKKHKGKLKRCTRVVTLGSFSQNGKKGSNVVFFTGRLRGHTLKPGTYTLNLVPASGSHKGKSVSVTFKIKK